MRKQKEPFRENKYFILKGNLLKFNSDVSERYHCQQLMANLKKLCVSKQSVNSKRVAMDENNAEKISEAIFNLIPEVTRLKELFQNWNLLNDDEKQYIDVQVEKWHSPGHIQLYKTVKQALVRWGKVQDTEGAPGCDPGWFTFSCDTQLEEELINVLQTVENLLKRTKQATSPSKSNFSNLTTMVEELTVVTALPDVPPSSPDSGSDDFILLNSPEKRRSEPIRMFGRSHSLHTGRRAFHPCHSVKSMPNIKDGYNTD